MSHGAKLLNKLMCDQCWADDSWSREVFWSQCWLKICGGVVLTENGLFLINCRLVNASKQVCPNTNQTLSPFSSTISSLYFWPYSCSVLSFSIVLLSIRRERGRRDLDVEVTMQGCVSAFYKNLLCLCVPRRHTPSLCGLSDTTLIFPSMCP